MFKQKELWISGRLWHMWWPLNKLDKVRLVSVNSGGWWHLRWERTLFLQTSVSIGQIQVCLSPFRSLPFKKRFATESVEWMHLWSRTSDHTSDHAPLITHDHLWSRTVHFHNNHIVFLLVSMHSPLTFSLHLWTSMLNTSAMQNHIISTTHSLHNFHHIT
jgi:hypothetical protein